MVDVDWTYGAAHLRDGHQVTVPDATEALTDPDALLFDQDPESRSGNSARLLGYSATAGAVLVVIVVHKDRAGWWARTAGGRMVPTSGPTVKGTCHQRRRRGGDRRGRRRG